MGGTQTPTLLILYFSQKVKRLLVYLVAKTFKKLGNIKKFEELRSLTKELIDIYCIDEKVKTKILNELNGA